MLLIVGLGNFGKPYINTYHNIGFMCVDMLSNKLGIKLDKKSKEAKYYEGVIENQKVIIAQPLKYMNLSGDAVLKLMQKFKVKPEEALIIYDDLDLPAGKTRYRTSGSGGTHKGMKHIVGLLGEDIPRIRIGFGRKEKQTLTEQVLSKITKEDKPLILDAVKKVSIVLEEIIKTDNHQKLEELNINC